MGPRALDGAYKRAPLPPHPPPSRSAQPARPNPSPTLSAQPCRAPWLRLGGPHRSRPRCHCARLPTRGHFNSRAIGGRQRHGDHAPPGGFLPDYTRSESAPLPHACEATPLRNGPFPIAPKSRGCAHLGFSDANVGALLLKRVVPVRSACRHQATPRDAGGRAATSRPHPCPQPLPLRSAG